MQQADWGRICVGYMISWWSPRDEETDSRSVSSLVELSPFHQEFDLQLKPPNITMKSGLLKLMSVITWSKIDKKLSKSFEDWDGER